MFITAYKLNIPLHTVLPISATVPITPFRINSTSGNSRHMQHEWNGYTSHLSQRQKAQLPAITALSVCDFLALFRNVLRFKYTAIT